MAGQRGRPPYPDAVTPAEQRVLDFLREGLTNAEIAVRLGVSVNTVRYHVSSLLQKAGVETRAELRGWQPAGSGRLRALAPFGALAPWAKWGLGVAGAAGVAVVTVAAVLALRGAGGGDEHAAAAEDPPATATPTVVAATPTPVRPRLDPGRVPPVDTVALVHWEQPESVALLDAQTGATLATYKTGYRPLVTIRRAAGELLVAHAPRDTSGNMQPQVLDVLDMNDGLTLKRRIATPDRPQATVGSPAEWATLSRDERYYAYSSQAVDRSLPECQGESYDGPHCTRTTAHVLDLEDPGATPFDYQLPRDCGVGAFRASGASSITVTCEGGQTFKLTPSGQVATAAGPARRFEVDPVMKHNLATVVFALSSDDGWDGALLSSGPFVWTRVGAPEVDYHAVPDGMRPRWPIWAEVGDGRLVVGFSEHYYDPHPQGLAIFNLETGVIERTLPWFDIGLTMVASGPETLLALTPDGELIAIDLATGTSRTLRSVGTGSEEMVLVR